MGVFTRSKWVGFNKTSFTGIYWKNYKDLDIQGGMEASIKYEDFFKGGLRGKELKDYWKEF